MADHLTAAARRLALVATDLDGTFLRTDGTISGRTRDAVKAAQEAGLTIAFVTARPPRIVRDLAREIGLEGVAVCSNGAILYDLAREEILHHSPLGGSLAQRIIQAVRLADPEALFAVEYGHMLGYEPRFPRIFEEAVNLHPSRVDEVENLCDAEVTKLIVHHPNRTPDALAGWIAPYLVSGGDVTHSGGPFVEIAASGISKATGLMVLCAQLGVSAQDVIAFGDMPNDLPMLQLAGVGVAVRNAHQVLLDAADHITSSNDSDGVAEVLEFIHRHRASPYA